MEIIKPPETLHELQNTKRAILDMMGNPYCDHLMYMDLIERKKEVESKIKELENHE